MVQYKDRKVIVCSPDNDIKSFDIVIRVLQGETLSLSAFINCLDYVVRMAIDLTNESGFHMKKESVKHIIYLAETITDADYAADTFVLLANRLAQVESLLHSVELAARSVHLCMF